jgi:hypothetical protein
MRLKVPPDWRLTWLLLGVIVGLLGLIMIEVGELICVHVRGALLAFRTARHLRNPALWSVFEGQTSCLKGARRR